ncbi:hypothetical protein HUU42_10445 [bacterium]|nr:hypothetical protein [bacterium]
MKTYIVAVLIFISSMYAAEGSQQDSIRIKRLADVAYIWGAIKYFHPYLSHKSVDWDSALVSAIPKVDSAKNRDDYQKAVEHLLSFLNDPNTAVYRKKNPVPLSSNRSMKPQPYVEWTPDSTAIVIANDWVYFTGFGASQTVFKTMKEIQHADRIIFDMRAFNGKEQSDWWLSYHWLRTIGFLLDRDLKLGYSRSRMHSGYAPQAGGASFYYSATVNKESTVLNGKNNVSTKKIAFIVSDGIDQLCPMLMGFQSAGMAAVVQDGKIEYEPGIEYHAMDIADDLTVSMRLTESIYPDGQVGFKPDTVLSSSADSSAALKAALAMLQQPFLGRSGKSSNEVAGQRLEKPYFEMAYPDREYRLLALFRFWNVIHYFFPYKHLLDRPWNSVLTEFIPQMELASDSLQYNLTVAKLVARIQDSHGFINSKVLRQYYGTHMPPLEVRWIGGESVITYVPDSIAKKNGINVGDIVVAVDNEEIAARRYRLLQTFAYSTPQSGWWDVHSYLLRGKANSVANLKLKSANDSIKEAQVERTTTYFAPQRKTPVFGILPEGFGYIDLERLTVDQIDTAMNTIRNTPGVILDMRGYPQGTAWSLAPRFAKRQTAVTAVFRRPEPHSPDTTAQTTYQFHQSVSPGGPWQYTGKVVMLIDEKAISQAEHTCLYMEAATDVTFIGMPTIGANGDITSTVLPGGITINFTGHDVRHGDGRQLQRLGIQPDIRIEPTIEGVRKGKDEILDRAIDFLKKIKSKK